MEQQGILYISVHFGTQTYNKHERWNLHSSIITIFRTDIVRQQSSFSGSCFIIGAVRRDCFFYFSGACVSADTMGTPQPSKKYLGVVSPSLRASFPS